MGRLAPPAQLRDTSLLVDNIYAELAAACLEDEADLAALGAGHYINRLFKQKAHQPSVISSLYNEQAQEAYIFGTLIDLNKLKEDWSENLLKEEDKCCKDSLNHLKAFLFKLRIPGVFLDPEFLNTYDLTTANQYLQAQK